MWPHLLFLNTECSVRNASHQGQVNTTVIIQVFLKSTSWVVTQGNRWLVDFENMQLCLKFTHLHTFILAHDSSQLQVAFNLLTDLLEAVYNRHGGDGVDTAQNVQSHIDQALLPCDLPILNNGWCGGMHSKHGIVSVWVMLCISFISGHNGCRRKKNKIVDIKWWIRMSLEFIATSLHTLVVVLPPHKDAAPMGEVIWDNWQPVSPGLHHGLHVVEAGVAAQVGRLEPCIYLSSFL